MNSAPISIVVRTAAAAASIAANLAQLSAVVSLSEPQRSQLIAATASRRIATQKSVVLVAQAKHAQPSPVAEVATR